MLCVLTSLRTPLRFLSPLVLCAALLWPRSAPAGDGDVDGAIVELSATALRTELAAGRLTAEQVTRAFLARIDAVDDHGPQLAAVIATNPDALDTARALDRRFRMAALARCTACPCS